MPVRFRPRARKSRNDPCYRYYYYYYHRHIRFSAAAQVHARCFVWLRNDRHRAIVPRKRVSRRRPSFDHIRAIPSAGRRTLRISVESLRICRSRPSERPLIQSTYTLFDGPLREILERFQLDNDDIHSEPGEISKAGTLTHVHIVDFAGRAISCLPDRSDFVVSR